jgi:hypothetical protein
MIQPLANIYEHSRVNAEERLVPICHLRLLVCVEGDRVLPIGDDFPSIFKYKGAKLQWLHGANSVSLPDAHLVYLYSDGV